VTAFLREAGIVEHERRHLRQFPIECPRQTRKQVARVPRAHHHALLQALPHRLDLIRAID
jgi:hypothetical protein